MTRVAVLDDYQGAALSSADWGRLPPDTQVETFNEHLADEDALAKRLGPFDVVVAMRERTPFPRSLLSRLPNLKLLVTTGLRNASIDVVAAKELGITVSGTRSMRTPTSELTWGLIISLARNIALEDKATREGAWQTTIGPSLEGKVLGIVGLGNLGSQVATVGRAFQMDVVAWSQNLAVERAAEYGARLVSKSELFATADVITIHLVLSARTTGIIGADELALMKPTAFIVNTSRGPIIDEAALIQALESGQIGGAALDVFDEEPLPANHKLRNLPNTVITPHIGYVTSDNYRIYFTEAVEDIAGFLDGAPIRVIE